MSHAFHHTLKTNKRSERPSLLIFYDVESHYPAGVKGEQPFTPFLWTAIFKQEQGKGRQATRIETHGSTPKELWDFVESKTYSRRTLYMMSHHLEPDFFTMNGISELTQRGWALNKFIQNNRVVMFVFKKGYRKLIVMNSGNLFPGSIEHWGKLFGFPKLDQPPQEAGIDEWLPYCMRDTQILEKMYDTLIDFMDKHNTGNFKTTISGIAKSAFTHRFMDHEICIHDDPDVIDLERASYHGGRCQALQPGIYTGQTIYQLDANGMYASIEMEEELPYRLRGYLTNTSPKQIAHLLKSYAVIAEVSLDVKEPAFPSIEKGKVVFRTGPQTLTLTTPELKYLIERGWPYTVKRAAYYDSAPIFKRYAEYFYDLKRQYKSEGNRAMELLSKQFPNSLYGKFGQKGHRDVIVGNCDPEVINYEEVVNIETGKSYALFYYGGKIHKVWEEGNARDSFVAIAAHVTAYGRMRLWRWMLQAGLENVYAVATDSLKVNQKGYERLLPLIDPLKPGWLKVEAKADDFICYAPNDSYFNGKLTCKGVPKRAEAAGPDSYYVTVWPHAKTLLKNGQFVGYRTRVVKKTLRREEFHRAMDPDWKSPDQKMREQRITAHKQRKENPRIYELSSRLSALQETRIVDRHTVFKYWDFKRGDFKRARNRQGILVPIEYSAADVDATEHGFADLDSFLKAIQQQVAIYQQARQIREELRYCLAELNPKRDNNNPL